ncbi:SDR family NAD(P)-dependent oxidoreductase [Dyadobacter sp.]|uniref:SDR family NAD(P)-dependent oxidoreductase n=1 Tax=Dyadobacter sp. TaxID=1914288 RepID=UPI003F71597D
MKTTGNTILITGGSAGIGWEIAKAFSVSGNQVIITGRDEQRLANAASQLKNVTPIVMVYRPRKLLMRLFTLLKQTLLRCALVAQNRCFNYT